jgi:hypothetical protein
MSVASSFAAVTTSVTPICTGIGWALLQNMGAAAVTVGNASVAVGGGVYLPAASSGIPSAPVPIRLFGGSDGEGDTLYGVSVTGTCNVAFALTSSSG